jgi:uncharacterized LabA/DUF88 family protein
MPEKTERVMIFIDGSNFYHGLVETIDATNVNLEKLGKFLCGKHRRLIRIRYYNAPLDQSKDPETYKAQQRWFEKVKNTPDVELVLVRMQKRINEKTGEMEYIVKGDDIHIGVDMVKFAYNDAYDTAILVSGDGDFYPAVEAVKDKGKRVENAYFSSNHSFLLRQKCNKSIKMDNFIEKCLE